MFCIQLKYVGLANIDRGFQGVPALNKSDIIVINTMFVEQPLALSASAEYTN